MSIDFVPQLLATSSTINQGGREGGSSIMKGTRLHHSVPAYCTVELLYDGIADPHIVPPWRVLLLAALCHAILRRRARLCFHLEDGVPPVRSSATTRQQNTVVAFQYYSMILSYNITATITRLRVIALRHYSHFVSLATESADSEMRWTPSSGTRVAELVYQLPHWTVELCFVLCIMWGENIQKKNLSESSRALRVELYLYRMQVWLKMLYR